MKTLRRLFKRLANLAVRRRPDQRLQEEIEEHLSLQTEEYVRAGMTPAEAHRRAILKLGPVGAIRESYFAEARVPFNLSCGISATPHGSSSRVQDSR